MKLSVCSVNIFVSFLVQCASKEQYEKSLQVHLTVSFGICVELLHKPNEVHSMNIKL